MALRHDGTSFFGSCKSSIFFSSPGKGMSPTESGTSWGDAAAGGTGEIPWRDRTGMP